MSIPARFRQADVTRAIRGAEQAGMRVGGFKISPDGEILVFRDTKEVRPSNNPWDRIFDS